ncbi:hypothetical protein L1987_57918 [Smallanthus sonchifolius]|uniref:Uncharacterized protein n=1 Tax=Smallanthus sonchifolius TaxID=185202 RepID=A0ACB9DE67_9ASTR|nr:hypothetical protein L1987_57918 [Smallanthus sonchifolius]
MFLMRLYFVGKAPTTVLVMSRLLRRFRVSTELDRRGARAGGSHPDKLLNQQNLCLQPTAVEDFYDFFVAPSHAMDLDVHHATPAMKFDGEHETPIKMRKYEDICAPQVEEVCYISDNTQIRYEVLEMDLSLLNFLKFQLIVPSPQLLNVDREDLFGLLTV